MGEQARIIVVDDDESIRESMKKLLNHEGYLVDLAVNGYEAIQKTDETSYDLALIDIRLPDIDGVELLKLMKDSVPRTRKIMLTGYPTMQNAIAALNKHADAYLVKPVEIAKLLDKVQEQLKLRKNEKSFNEQTVAEFIESRVSEIFSEQE